MASHIKFHYGRYALCAVLLFVLLRLIRRPTPHPIEETVHIPAEFGHDDPGFLESYDNSKDLHQHSSVYFIESSAPFKRIITIEPRQACAIESAARANPGKKIIVLFASWNSITEPSQMRFPDLLSLVHLRNVHFRWLDLYHFAKGTPVEAVIRSDKLYERPNGAEYLSEILRLVLLYRYGGIYLDLDVVTLKGLDFLNPNFVGAETEQLVGSSVIGLNRPGIGELFAERCLDNFKYFEDQNNVRNGSVLLTYQVVQTCEKHTLPEVLTKGCSGMLHVHGRSVFHPFDETNVDIMFDPGRLEEAKRRIANATTVHMLHRTTGKMRVAGKPTGYMLIAKNYCPKVYDKNMDKF